jgi:hypothetical protein
MKNTKKKDKGIGRVVTMERIDQEGFFQQVTFEQRAEYIEKFQLCKDMKIVPDIGKEPVPRP